MSAEVFPVAMRIDSVSAEALAAVIERSGVFDRAAYAASAELPADIGLRSAILDYLTRGEAAGFKPHLLFDPSHVRGQFAAAGLEIENDSVLGTYLSHPDMHLDPHPFFDSGYFFREDQSVTHLEDYLRRWRSGSMPPSPHVLFHPDYYKRRYADVAASGAEPFVHFLLWGYREGRESHPLFNVPYWRSQLAAFGLECRGENPVLAYCTDRATWTASPHPLFDPVFFATSLASAGLSPSLRQPPLVDMLAHRPQVPGFKLFDPNFYRMNAAHVGVTLTDHPLCHYVQAAPGGDIDPHPLFCDSFYARQCPGLAETRLTALEHFVQKGEADGRDPNPLFSQTHYRSANPGVRAGETRLLEHYLSQDLALLETHPLFDARTYAAQHPDCRTPGDTPLSHYSRMWAERGLRFPPWGSALFPRRQAMSDRSAPEVVLVAHELTRTGAPAILLRIVRDLVERRGLRTLVLAIDGGELLEDFREWSSTVDLSYVRSVGITDADFLRRLSTTFAAHQRPRFMLVNTACIDPDSVTLGPDVPVLTLIHEMASSFSEARFQRIYETSAAVVYPAEFVRNEAHVLYSLPAEKTAVLSQGLLDPNFGRADPTLARAALIQEIGAGADAFIVLGCGTLNMRKGLDTFVHVAGAALRAAERGPAGRPLHFVWIGDGPRSTHTVDWYAHQDIDRGGLADRVHLLGPRVSAEPYFLGCNAFVMTSRMDPFPCVIHEAMACAKPIIAFAGAGGAPEALGAGAGIIVGYGDIEAMVTHILALRANPAAAAALGMRAREVVGDRYAFTDYVDRIMEMVDHRLGVAVREPHLPVTRSADRRRVIVTCGDAEPQANWHLSETLVGWMLERGFDAELVFTGDIRTLKNMDRVRTVPHRVLIPSIGRPISLRQRWDALTRVLEVGAPAVLIHNLDVIGSALAPVPCKGVGILGIVHSILPRQLEQVVRLGRYWQRVVTPSEALGQRVLDALPSLGDRLRVIPRSVRRHAAPQRREDSRALAIVIAGQNPQRESKLPFLLPLVRGLQRAGVNFTLTAIGVGPEAELLKAALPVEMAQGRVRVIQSGTIDRRAPLLVEADVCLVLSGESAGDLDLFEAMSAGLAVISIDRPRDRDPRLVDGVQGFIIPTANVQQCVGRLVELDRDRDRLQGMRQAAFDIAQTLPNEVEVGDAYAALVDEMLHELRSGFYAKPAPIYTDPIIGAISLPPLFATSPSHLGYPNPL
jgi:glycosyltransferase involved in cell wall biosynthesis